MSFPLKWNVAWTVILYKTKHPCLFHLSGILLELWFYYRTKHPCPFDLSGILTEPWFYYRTKYLCHFLVNPAKQATMSFLVEVIPPVCWIMLYLLYFIFWYCKWRGAWAIIHDRSRYIVIIVLLLIIIIIITELKHS